jgi:L-asparaginase II
LAALAPVQATAVTLAELLRSNRIVFGRRSTVMIITPQTGALPDNQDWTAELLQLQNQGLVSSVMLITHADEDEQTGQLRNLLMHHEIPVQALPIGTHLPSALTFRRTRTVVRNTPTGGAVSYEVEEDVG